MNAGETERCETCEGYPEWCENCTLRLYLEAKKNEGKNEPAK